MITANLLQTLILERQRVREYVSVGLGKEDDFKDLDLTGTSLNPTRGNSISEKIANAFHHGAAGALVYNNVEGSNLEWQFSGRCEKDPICLLLQNVMGKL